MTTDHGSLHDSGPLSPLSSLSRLSLNIRGAVQGVGFRPFVYRLATELSLTGWVLNDPRGVHLEVEGPRPVLERFLERLSTEKPPLSRIHALEAAWLAPTGFHHFEIRHSEAGGGRTALVLPDSATCPDCLHDTLDPDPANRRTRYPFTNCTNCGPRFTILQALPYDRPNTTMRGFVMCAACQAEYDDPSDRRFHAQPNACPVCGPHLSLWKEQEPGVWAPEAEGDDALRRASDALRDGQIVAVKGLGGFHLMTDARNVRAIGRLRERKPRPDKPFALMVRDVAQAHTLCRITPPEESLLTSAEAPIVLLPKRDHSPGEPELAQSCDALAPDAPDLGLMLPATPLHHLLLHETGFPVVATSGNLSDEPICTDEHEATERLGHLADLFLVHNRPIARHVDDSIAWMVGGEGVPRLLRRARGYAPLPVLVRGALPTILAVGGHLKNTIALSLAPPPSLPPEEAPDTPVFISQHLGDLETVEAMHAFERVIDDFLRLYEATPVAIAHDLHPDYRSTRWAQEAAAGSSSPLARLPLIPVQHHHAHLASCLADQGDGNGNGHGSAGPALGVTWDGSGYGVDGTVWGGEFLLGDATGYTRVAHLRPFLLPGGEAAVREPRRVALALLWELFGEAALERDDLAPVRAFGAAERRLLAQMMGQKVNTPTTTSAGRLFDGVAALIGVRQTTTFEGQAAMGLEGVADPTVTRAYPLPLVKSSNGGATPLVLDWRPLVEGLLRDLHGGVSPAIMAAQFHNALGEAIGAVARAVGEPRVALTGGCFQNRLLTTRTARRLREDGFGVLLQRQVPPNDGGISLGQVMVAAAYQAKNKQYSGKNGK